MGSVMMPIDRMRRESCIRYHPHVSLWFAHYRGGRQGSGGEEKGKYLIPVEASDCIPWRGRKHSLQIAGFTGVRFPTKFPHPPTVRVYLFSPLAQCLPKQLVRWKRG